MRTDDQELIDNEFCRVLIQNHADYTAWRAGLGIYACQALDILMEEDVTPELIQFAQEASEHELLSFQFLAAIAGGSPEPIVKLVLTNFVLYEIYYAIRCFGEENSSADKD